MAKKTPIGIYAVTVAYESFSEYEPGEGEWEYDEKEYNVQAAGVVEAAQRAEEYVVKDYPKYKLRNIRAIDAVKKFHGMVVR